MKLTITNIKIKNYYYAVHDYNQDNEELLMANFKYLNIRRRIIEEAKRLNATVNEDENILLQSDSNGALIMLKHEDTNTNFVVEIMNEDHDGNELHIYDENNKLVALDYDTEFTEHILSELLYCLAKYPNKPSIKGNIMEFEESNSCWFETIISEEVKDEDVDAFFEGLEKYDEEIESSGIMTFLLNRFSGKKVYLKLDCHGGIFDMREITDVNEIDYIDINIDESVFNYNEEDN